VERDNRYFARGTGTVSIVQSNISFEFGMSAVPFPPPPLNPNKINLPTEVATDPGVFEIHLTSKLTQSINDNPRFETEAQLSLLFGTVTIPMITPSNVSLSSSDGLEITANVVNFVNLISFTLDLKVTQFRQEIKAVPTNVDKIREDIQQISDSITTAFMTWLTPITNITSVISKFQIPLVAVELNFLATCIAVRLIVHWTFFETSLDTTIEVPSHDPGLFHSMLVKRLVAYLASTLTLWLRNMQSFPQLFKQDFLSLAKCIFETVATFIPSSMTKEEPFADIFKHLISNVPVLKNLISTAENFTQNKPSASPMYNLDQFGHSTRLPSEWKTFLPSKSPLGMFGIESTKRLLRDLAVRIEEANSFFLEMRTKAESSAASFSLAVCSRIFSTTTTTTS